MDQAKKTVFVTGASSGTALQTALLFLDRGWNVVATMCRPEERSTPLHGRHRAELLHLDVTGPASINDAIRCALAAHRRIDVLVNNAGYALYGPFEAATEEQVPRQFATNTLGLPTVVREFPPAPRRRQRCTAGLDDAAPGAGTAVLPASSESDPRLGPALRQIRPAA